MEPSSHEPIRDIAHLGSVELLTPRFDKSLWYFRDVLGMEVVHTAGESAWLRSYGDYAAATLKLTASSHAGPGCIAWRGQRASARATRRGDRERGLRPRLERRRVRARALLPLPRP